MSFQSSIPSIRINIENVVATGILDKQIDLKKISKRFDNSKYNPEQFPGIIHRLHYPKTVILLFASGKLVCTGAKKTIDIHDSVNQFCYLLEEKDLFVKKDVS